MSNQRTNMTDDKEINKLVSKLHSLLPESRCRNTSKASTSKLLEEICSYIKSLQREVDDLCGRLPTSSRTLSPATAAGLLRSSEPSSHPDSASYPSYMQDGQ